MDIQRFEYDSSNGLRTKIDLTTFEYVKHKKFAENSNVSSYLNYSSIQPLSPQIE